MKKFILISFLLACVNASAVTVCQCNLDGSDCKCHEEESAQPATNLRDARNEAIARVNAETPMPPVEQKKDEVKFFGITIW